MYNADARFSKLKRSWGERDYDTRVRERFHTSREIWMAVPNGCYQPHSRSDNVPFIVTFACFHFEIRNKIDRPSNPLLSRVCFNVTRRVSPSACFVRNAKERHKKLYRWIRGRLSFESMPQKKMPPCDDRRAEALPKLSCPLLPLTANVRAPKHILVHAYKSKSRCAVIQNKEWKLLGFTGKETTVRALCEASWKASCALRERGTPTSIVRILVNILSTGKCSFLDPQV